jgi:hypothetical protein
MAEYESLHEALVEAVKEAGGSKVVAAALWPAAAARDLDGARRKLTNSLDADRAEKLSLDELIHVMRMARDAGCHAPMHYLCQVLGYAAPWPVAPRDEADTLRREVLALGRTLGARLARLEALDPRAPVGQRTPHG